jgi:hypothetical protein
MVIQKCEELEAKFWQNQQAKRHFNEFWNSN